MQAPGRIIFNRLPGQLEVTIPTKKNWVTLIIFLVMICLWLITGGLVALMALPAKKEIDYSDWVWGLWGIAIILITLRSSWQMLAEKEIISFSRETFSIKKAGSTSRSRKYELSKARYFRIEEDEDNDSVIDGRQAGVIGSGPICFNYERQTIRFANGITEAEANTILNELKRLKILTGKNL